MAVIKTFLENSDNAVSNSVRLDGTYTILGKGDFGGGTLTFSNEDVPLTDGVFTAPFERKLTISGSIVATLAGATDGNITVTATKITG